MTLDIGSRVTVRNFHELKPGTRMTNQYGQDDLVVLDNFHLTSAKAGWMNPIRALTDYTLVVTALPPFERTIPETIEGFRQRMSTTIYGQSRNHSVTTGPAEDACRVLGLPANGGEIGVGMWVHASDDRLVRRLPDQRGRRVLFQIGDPNYDWDEYGLFNSIRSGSTAIEGGMTRWPFLLRLVKVEGVTLDPNPYLRTPTEDDARQIAALKGEAWRLGLQAKSAHGWCPSFESSMSLLGLSEHVTYTAEAPEGTDSHALFNEPFPVATESPYENGRVLTSREAINVLPNGAIVAWPPGNHRGDLWSGSWCLFQLNDTGVRWGMVNFMGPNNGGHTTDAQVLWNGVGQMRIPIPSPEVMNTAPVGTMVGTGGSRTYQRQSDGRWRSVSGAGPVRCQDFFVGGSTDYEFTQFPRMDAAPPKDLFPLAA